MGGVAQPPEGAARGPRRPSPLQAYLEALYDTLGDARAELDEESYLSFIRIACERVGAEAGRLLFGELLRRDRPDDDKEAA